MNRRAILIGAAVSVLLIVVWYLVLWSPASGRLAEAKTRREAAETQEQTLALEVQRLEAAARDEPQKRARLAGLKIAIPEDIAIAEFILDVNSISSQSGIDFLSVSQSVPAAFSGAVGATPTNQMTISINITGGYFQILDFMNRLTGLPRLVTVESMTLSPGDPNMTASLSGRIFTSGTLTPTTLPPATTTTTTAAPA